MRINVGCGQFPTPGWENFDNSFSVRLAKAPFLCDFLAKMGIIGESQKQFIRFAYTANIKYANATQRIPLSAGSVDVLYSSHILEHLDRRGARRFLAEARRVIKSQGIIRIVVPDIGLIVKQYISSGDADAFINKTMMASPNPQTVLDRMRYLFVGNRHHLWMYDGHSLCLLLVECGFVNAQVLTAGTTRIPDPSPLNLMEREEESVYVEALNP